jgi:hypothetical protein
MIPAQPFIYEVIGEILPPSKLGGPVLLRRRSEGERDTNIWGESVAVSEVEHDGMVRRCALRRKRLGLSFSQLSD